MRSVPGLDKVGAFAYDVGESSCGVRAESAVLRLLVMGGVSNRSIFSVPPEVPYASDFPHTTGNVPLAEVPYSRGEQIGGTSNTQGVLVSRFSPIIALLTGPAREKFSNI